MGQNDDDGQSTPKRDEAELAHDARVALLAAVTKAAEAGNGNAAAQFVGAYRALKQCQPTAERPGTSQTPSGLPDGHDTKPGKLFRYPDPSKD
jgi:hypothetical protein